MRFAGARSFAVFDGDGGFPACVDSFVCTTECVDGSHGKVLEVGTFCVEEVGVDQQSMHAAVTYGFVPG